MPASAVTRAGNFDEAAAFGDAIFYTVRDVAAGCKNGSKLVLRTV
jgi:hypothetical protein